MTAETKSRLDREEYLFESRYVEQPMGRMHYAMRGQQGR